MGEGSLEDRLEHAVVVEAPRLRHPSAEPAPRGLRPTARERNQPNLAKLTVARNVAAIVLAMWKTEEAYDPERVEFARQ